MVADERIPLPDAGCWPLHDVHLGPVEASEVEVHGDEAVERRYRFYSYGDAMLLVESTVPPV